MKRILAISAVLLCDLVSGLLGGYLTSGLIWGIIKSRLATLPGFEFLSGSGDNKFIELGVGGWVLVFVAFLPGIIPALVANLLLWKKTLFTPAVCILLVFVTWAIGAAVGWLIRYTLGWPFLWTFLGNRTLIVSAILIPVIGCIFLNRFAWRNN